MAIAVDLDPAWTTGTGTNAVTSTAFSPAANSLIVVQSVCDSGTGTITCAVTDSVGLTWTQIGTAQVGTGGGTVADFWAFTSTTHAGMTVTATWTGSGTTSTKGVKPTTYTGTASTSAVVSKAQSTSATNNLSVNVTNTNNGCRMAATGIEWNALGLPTSTDTAVAFHSAGNIDGISVYKAANTSGTGQTVSLDFDAGGTGAAAWSYKIFEIVPAGGTDASPAPAVAAGVAAAPAPTLQTGATTTPGTALTVAAVGSTTVLTGTVVTPAVVAAVATVGSPAVTTGEAVSASTVSAAVAIGSPSVSTGGGGGTQALDFGTPDFPDNADGAVYVLATEWVPDVDGTSPGNRWLPPTSTPGTDLYMVLYELGNTTPLATQAFSSPTLGVEMDVMFGSAVAVTAGTHYISGVLTDRYAATANYTGWPVVSGDLTAPDAVNGRLAVTTADTPAYPGTISGNAATYFIGPLFQASGSSSDATASPSVVTGLAAVGVASLSAGTTSTPTTVVALVAVPAPTVTVTSTAMAAPAMVAAFAAIPAPSVRTGTTASPAVVTGFAASSAPTVRISVTAAPGVVAALASVGGFDGVEVDATVTPLAIPAIAAAPVPTVSTSSAGTPTPTTVTAFAAVGTPATHTGQTATPNAVTSVATVAAPSVSTGSAASVAPAAVTGLATVPAPLTSGGATPTPAFITGLATVPTPSVLAGGGITVGPVTVRAVAALPTPRIPTASTGGRIRSRVRTSHITSRVRNNDLISTGA